MSDSKDTEKDVDATEEAASPSGAGEPTASESDGAAAELKRGAEEATMPGDEADRAADVASALGVGEGDGAESSALDAAAPENRAERRRKRAAARRARRKGMEVTDDELSQDRNQRQRELLERRRASAGAEDEGEGPGKLATSEMIDDALARGTASFLKWMQRNWSTVQWVVLAVIVLGVGGLIYTYRVTTNAEEASRNFSQGVYAEQSAVVKEDKRTDKEKKQDPRTLYSSLKDRDAAALKDYRKAAIAHGAIGPGILARLGEAGVLLDQEKYDEAVKAYSEVLATSLASADVDVQARALEGKAFAQEGKKDLAGATKSFEEMGKLPGDGYRLTAQYHRARLLLAAGKKDEAKKMLTETRKKVEKANIDGSSVDGAEPFKWLNGAVLASLRQIDPSLAPARLPGGGAGLSQERLQQMLRQQGLSGSIPGLPGGIPGQ